jgi:hypothetical protein
VRVGLIVKLAKAPEPISVPMVKLLMSSTLLAALAAPAFSQQVADTMTCAQAISAYARDGMISKVANGKFIVPIYGWTPIAQAASLQCGGRGSYLGTLTLRTTDNRRCVVAVRCQR